VYIDRHISPFEGGWGDVIVYTRGDIIVYIKGDVI